MLFGKQREISMTLKCDTNNEEKELDFELDYQLSLTTARRFEMMFARSREIMETLIRNERRKPFEVINLCYAKK